MSNEFTESSTNKEALKWCSKLRTLLQLPQLKPLDLGTAKLSAKECLEKLKTEIGTLREVNEKLAKKGSPSFNWALNLFEDNLPDQDDLKSEKAQRKQFKKLDKIRAKLAAAGKDRLQFLEDSDAVGKLIRGKEYESLSAFLKPEQVKCSGPRPLRIPELRSGSVNRKSSAALYCPSSAMCWSYTPPGRRSMTS